MSRIIFTNLLKRGCLFITLALLLRLFIVFISLLGVQGAFPLSLRGGSRRGSLPLLASLGLTSVRSLDTYCAR